MSGGQTLYSSNAGASADEFEALQVIIEALRPLDLEARNRILESVATFLGVAPIAAARSREVLRPPTVSGHFSNSTSSSPAFSENTNMSPKDFLNEKRPKTDVERIACLAYYLTHYRDTQHFKTLEISALNTEAAQPKFSNTANSTMNAAKMGYIVPSTKGHRQLSALGERFVLALPDRVAAKDVLLSLRRRSKRRKSSVATEPSGDE
jgi:hypothetical protein